MRTLFSNRYLDAFAKSIFLFGVLHMVILIILAFLHGHRVLNIFTILDLHSFAPGLEDGISNFVLSQCVGLAVYCFVFSYWTEKTRKYNSK